MSVIRFKACCFEPQNAFQGSLLIPIAHRNNIGLTLRHEIPNNLRINSIVSPFPSGLIVVRLECAALEACSDSHHPCGSSMYQLMELQGEENIIGIGDFEALIS